MIDNSPGTTGNRIGSLVNHILENLISPMSASQMAKSANVSIYHFYKLFRRETGFTLNQFIRHHRLEKAKELLESTNLQVKEIMHLVGIEDLSHFVRDFKTKYGLTPKNFRQAYHNGSILKNS